MLQSETFKVVQLIILNVCLTLYCVADINECDSNPCENSGACADGINSYTCACVDGYTGTHCELSNYNISAYLVPHPIYLSLCSYSITSYIVLQQVRYVNLYI